MAFSRKTTRYYMDEEDIAGAMRILSDDITDAKERLEEGEDVWNFGPDMLMKVGALLTLEIIRANSFIDNGKRFAMLLDSKIKEIR